MVRALVYQPSGPGFDSWHVSFRVNYYKGKDPNDAAVTYQVFVNYMLIYYHYKSLKLGSAITLGIIKRVNNAIYIAIVV